MTAREMQIAFVTELTNIGKTVESEEMPGSDIIFYFINRAVEKFVKTRYSGMNIKGESFEETQKRIEDLRTLIIEVTISTSTNTTKPNAYKADLPADYFITASEEVDIYYSKNSVPITLRQGIKEITSDRYRNEIDNPYGSHVLHYGLAKPLRLYQGEDVLLISDGQYTIPTYYLRYLKYPTVVALPSTDCDLPDHTHIEIVKLAIGMFLENIKDNRYGSYSNEINTME
jgi:hypothetical protein